MNFTGKPRVYISGPINGVADYRKNFAEAAERLEAMGFDVCNPAESHIDDGAPLGEIMLDDLEALDGCDFICLLDGWMGSDGCQIEFSFARYVGIGNLELQTQ